MKGIMHEKIDIIDKVCELMKRMRNLKRRAELRKFTNVSPLLCNDKLSSSTFEILRRYIKIKEHLLQLHVKNIEDFIPSRKEQDAIFELCKTLDSLDSITKC